MSPSSSVEPEPTEKEEDKGARTVFRVMAFCYLALAVASFAAANAAVGILWTSLAATFFLISMNSGDENEDDPDESGDDPEPALDADTETSPVQR